MGLFQLAFQLASNPSNRPSHTHPHTPTPGWNNLGWLEGHPSSQAGISEKTAGGGMR
jgi:hypothetical protein